jgi:hypothetical protein
MPGRFPMHLTSPAARKGSMVEAGDLDRRADAESGRAARAFLGIAAARKSAAVCHQRS